MRSPVRVSSTLLFQNQPCLVFQSTLAKQIGRSEALFLQQLHYWLQKGHMGRHFNGRRWIYNTAQTWGEQLNLSSRQIQRIVAKLRDRGLIDTMLMNDQSSDRTLSYTLCYDRLEKLMADENHDDSGRYQGVGFQDAMSWPSGQKVQNITEITSKNIITHQSEGEPSTNSLFQKPKPQPNQQVENDSFQKKEQTERFYPPKNTTAQDMLQIWNDVVGKDSPASMTKDRARYLVAAFKVKFESNMDRFRAYCQRISSSDFLMGRVKATFKATIDWVLKFSTIQRIQEGQFGVKDEVNPLQDMKDAFLPQTEQQANQGLQEPNLQESLHTQQIQQQEVLQPEIRQCDKPLLEGFHLKLLKSLGAARYHSWKASIKDIVTGEGGLTFLMTTPFARDWMNTHMKTDMEHALGQRIELILG